MQNKIAGRDLKTGPEKKWGTETRLPGAGCQTMLVALVLDEGTSGVPFRIRPSDLRSYPLVSASIAVLIVLRYSEAPLHL